MTEITRIGTKKGIWNSPYYMMVVLMIGVLMMALDMYVFSPALNVIVQYFNTSYDWVAWTMTIYLLFSTSVLPLAGKLSDVFGRKRVYIAGVLLFTLGSLACSLSWDIYSLVAFRAVQAIGGGIILPAALSAMGSAAPEGKQGKTMGALMAMSALAMVVGPNIGGYIIQNFGWRWVFYINLPLGVLAILLSLLLKESYGEEKHHIDIVGAGLLGVSLAALLYGIVRLETLPLTDVTVFPLFGASLVLLIALVLYERRTREPILDIPLLMRGDVLSLNMAMLVTMLGMTSAMIFVPTFAQVILHSTIQDSGTLLTPMSISLFAFAIIGGVLLDKVGAKPMLIAGTAVSIVALYVLAEYVTDTTGLAIALVIMGAGFGLGMGAFQVLMLTLTPGTEKGTSSAVLNTFKGIGGAIGPVIGGYFLTNAKTYHLYTLGQAFNYIFLFAVAGGIVALVFLAYLVGRDLFGRKRALAPEQPADDIAAIALDAAEPAGQAILADSLPDGIAPGFQKLRANSTMIPDGGSTVEVAGPRLRSIFSAESLDLGPDAGQEYEIRIRLTRDVLEAFKQNCFETELNKSEIAERALKAYLGIK